MFGHDDEWFGSRYRGRRVLVTGHTGFKGSWLTRWLHRLGAEVHGLALNPSDDQRLFADANLSRCLATDHRVDLRDHRVVADVVARAAPEFVFHLAAQPLVRLSYAIPRETFEVNVIGTATVLDAVLSVGGPCNVVCVTTDKCYENREWEHAYRETDAMGGHDPYSASKGCAELLIASYRRSFTADADHPVRIASARAGNVIGGGDWAADRIVPDVFRAALDERAVEIRNRTATRPWQHVLEPLGGYLHLGSMLDGAGETRRPAVRPADCTDGFNFGPTIESNRTVAELVESFAAHIPLDIVDASDPNAPHEAGRLNLSTDRATHRLGWRPVWDFATTIEVTADFYVEQQRGTDARTLMDRQIRRYVADALDSSDGSVGSGDETRKNGSRVVPKAA